ncbi:hypothetical protein E3P92_00922 [Wallemia ichthyophaga]|uniref:Uncharacterized protein n=1 Tax=Wallemia ichthyophaga TaxID=245174 RepID=A0A4T0F7B2_WALIC|nr:hypothetical protein E3P91_00657 [Wallemia ichthyophaga]TIA83687.1 hypothetical protein E3P98_00649 [Wallemia ichthyophaga]TIB02606.1 hypothetical protein E3P95_00875 [Wallemia ichthyophaga]TIB03573.1 hypothetical protein E3P94_01007 [Wallemia ichthyophaga]TIB15653.1 hypothetical protein E3P90_00795 [Wallemia ichthyophaga]
MSIEAEREMAANGNSYNANGHLDYEDLSQLYDYQVDFTTPGNISLAARQIHSQNKTSDKEADMSGSPFGISANPEARSCHLKGGYAVGGAKTGLPLGKATVYDKMVGNIDYVLAFITRSDDQKVSSSDELDRILTPIESNSQN